MATTSLRGSGAGGTSQLRSIANADVAPTAAIQSTKLASWSASRDGGGNRLINLGTPVNPTDGAHKAYVDAVASNTNTKKSARVATTANIVLSAPQTIDGVAAIAGDRVLVKNQTLGQDNGIYDVAAGAWVRSSDADVSVEVTAGMTVPVSEGTVQKDTGWFLTTDDPINLDVTPLAFAQIWGSGGGLTAGQHEMLRQLIHFIDNGPAKGFASGAYREINPPAAILPTTVTWWDDVTMVKKIVAKTIAYTGVLPTTITWDVYDTDGVTILETIVDAIVYSGVFEINRTRTIV